MIKDEGQDRKTVYSFAQIDFFSKFCFTRTLVHSNIYPAPATYCVSNEFSIDNV